MSTTSFPSLTHTEFNQACQTLETKSHDNLNGTEWISVEFKIHPRFDFERFLNSSSGSTSYDGRNGNEDYGVGRLSLSLSSSSSSDDDDDDGDGDGDGDKEEEKEEEKDRENGKGQKLIQSQNQSRYRHRHRHPIETRNQLESEGQGEMLIRVKKRLNNVALSSSCVDRKGISTSGVSTTNCNDVFDPGTRDTGHLSSIGKMDDKWDEDENMNEDENEHQVGLSQFIDDQEDMDALLRQPILPSPQTSFSPNHYKMIDFSIVLSPTYQVPVLWFSFPDSPSVRAEDLQQVYTHIVTSQSHDVLRKVGVMGGISIANHPITDKACFFIHPCNTPEALRSMVVENRTLSPVDYLLLWFGIIGSTVGLHVPSKLLMS